MRTVKELLQLMLDNKHLFQVGLCGWVGHLYGETIIDIDEMYKLRDYIQDNRPSKFSSFDAYSHRNSSFYWTRYDIKPRIKWLKKHIKKS